MLVSWREAAAQVYAAKTRGLAEGVAVTAEEAAAAPSGTRMLALRIVVEVEGVARAAMVARAGRMALEALGRSAVPEGRARTWRAARAWKSWMVCCRACVVLDMLIYCELL